LKLIKKIKTDSIPPNEPKDPDQSSVFTLYSEFADPQQVIEMRDRFQNGISWGDAKTELYQVMDLFLEQPRNKYNELMANPEQIDAILSKGAEKARALAIPLLDNVKRRIGRFT
jgi:tryptophanyl-tRNA synthetase